MARFRKDGSLIPSSRVNHAQQQSHRAMQIRAGTTNLRVVGYARASQDESGDQLSVQQQAAKIEPWTKDKSWTLVGQYIDDDVTGRISIYNRPDGGRLMQAAKQSAFDVVVVYRLDRFGRRGKWSLEAIDDLEDMGIVVRSIEEGYDTLSPNASILKGVLATIGEAEWEAIRARTTDARIHHLTVLGRWVQGPLPFGYDFKDDRIPFPSERGIPQLGITESQAVQTWFFEKIATHEMTAWGIARRWNELGIPSLVRLTPDCDVVKKIRKQPTAGLWTDGRIIETIRNPIYSGQGIILSTKQGEVRFQFPPLVSPDLQERAKRALTENRDLSFRPGATVYTLRGRLRCVDGPEHAKYSAMTGQAKQRTDGSLYRSYRCRGRNDPKHPGIPNAHACTMPQIPADEVEALVWDKVRSVLVNPTEHVIRARQRIRDLANAQDSNLVQHITLQRRLKEVHAQRENAKQLGISGVISLDEARDAIAKINKQIQNIELALQNIKSDAELLGEYDAHITTVEALIQELAPLVERADRDRELQAKVIREFVIRVDVHYLGVLDGHGRLAITLATPLGTEESVVVQDALTCTLDYKAPLFFTQRLLLSL